MDKKLEEKLNELVAEIGSVPADRRKKFIARSGKMKKKFQDLKKSVNGVQDSLDYLRVCIKYLVFDLEATRRENNYLRRLLEDKKD